jgi:hypothetical protein
MTPNADTGARLIPEWPLFHDNREDAEACPACNQSGRKP